MSDKSKFVPDPPIRCRDYRIGAIGAGFIMADVQLASYKEAGFPVAAIASRTRSNAEQVARRWGIAKTHDTPQALIEDPGVEILDIAYPPDQQPALIRLALGQKHIRAILAQKPLALDLATAKAVVAEAKAAGKMLSVNQNMRFDQSMRVLKQILDRGDLGEPVIATIEMRAIPHWQTFLAAYDRLTLLNMSVHHLDVLRFLLGDPIDVFTAARPDPRTKFVHRDGVCASTLRFPSGALAVSLEDVWTGPHEEGFEVRHLHQMANGGHERARGWDHRLARLPEGQSEHAALFLPDDRRQMDSAELGHTLVSRCFPRRDGAAPIRREDGNRAGAERGGQSQDHGAGRSRVPLPRRAARRGAVGIRRLT